MTEKYCFDIGEEGQQGLDILDYLFNTNTKEFLLQAGLDTGMRVLDIGCGLGTMTQWLAKQVGPKGQVTAIDSNEYQIKATLKQAEANNISNINAICRSAYDIDKLAVQFDFVYCRFILHHLVHPSSVIQKVYDVLPSGGIYAAEEGLVNQAFSYPISPAWGHERWQNNPENHDTEGKSRDGNFGMKLYTIMQQTGFTDLNAQLYQPLLTKPEDKRRYLDAAPDAKGYFLEQGHSEADWQAHLAQLQQLVDNDAAIMGFYQSCQVSGIK